MIKYSTIYTINDKSYFSEIFCPETSNIEIILNQRNLPNEIITSVEISPNPPTDPISSYIQSGKYVDAMHRFFYLATIVGETLDFISYIQDDGLVHKMAHMKAGTETHDVPQMVTEADDFEKTVPGTYLWSLNQ